MQEHGCVAEPRPGVFIVESVVEFPGYFALIGLFLATERELKTHGG